MIIMMPHVDLTCAEHMHHSFKDIAVEVAGPGDGGHSDHSEDDLLDMARKREEPDTKRPKRGLAANGPLATLGSQAVGLEDAILIDENNEIKQQDATESIEAPSFSESDSEGSSSSPGSESSHGTAKEVTECNDAAPSTCSPVVIAYDPQVFSRDPSMVHIAKKGAKFFEMNGGTEVKELGDAKCVGLHSISVRCFCHARVANTLGKKKCGGIMRTYTDLKNVDVAGRRPAFCLRQSVCSALLINDV